MSGPGRQPSSDRRLVRAVAHPTRVEILRKLRDRTEASPIELSRHLRLPLGHVSYHVRRLQLLGAIELVGTTQRRGVIEHHYGIASSASIEELLVASAGD
jgi:DNA-binding transcriptional ArsR family regulator